MKENDLTNVENGAENSGADSKPEETQPELTLDDFLKDPIHQGDFDKRVNKAIETAKAKWDKEAEMSAEEIAEAQYNEKLQEIEEREKAQDRREFVADIREDLIENSLPTVFADLIADGTTRDDYPTVLKEIKTEWDNQISEQLKASARQKDPKASDAARTDVKMDLAEFAEQNRKVN